MQSVGRKGGHGEMVLDLFDDSGEGGRIISRGNSLGEERCLGWSRRGLVNRWVRYGCKRPGLTLAVSLCRALSLLAYFGRTFDLLPGGTLGLPFVVR